MNRKWGVTVCGIRGPASSYIRSMGRLVHMIFSDYTED